MHAIGWRVTRLTGIHDEDRAKRTPERYGRAETRYASTHHNDVVSSLQWFNCLFQF